MNEKYSPLFTPWKIGNVEIKNRIVQVSMGGTSLFGWLEPCHFDKEAAYHLMNRAQNNVGLIRFLMMTGVSKFTKLSVFSGLNNLQDLTIEKPEYAALLGYTVKEIESVFAPHLKAFARKQRVPQEKAITTESLAEPYMKYVAGQLSWDSVESFQVPAFMTVYEGLVYTFGRTCNHHTGPVTDDVACVLMAEGYSFGEQLGWISADAYLNSPYKAFLRAVIRDRYEHREYFTAGGLMRPPKVECELPEIAGETLAGEFRSPTVKACLRRRERDGGVERAYHGGPAEFSQF